MVRLGICDCVHRGKPNHKKNSGGADERSCYVMLLGVLSVWKSYQKGNYPTIQGHDTIAELGKDRMVRLGTYGDSSAVPSYVWDSLLSKSEGRTGYVHQFGVQGADVRTDLILENKQSIIGLLVIVPLELASLLMIWSKVKRYYVQLQKKQVDVLLATSVSYVVVTL